MSRPWDEEPTVVDFDLPRSDPGAVTRVDVPIAKKEAAQPSAPASNAPPARARPRWRRWVALGCTAAVLAFGVGIARLRSPEATAPPVVKSYAPAPARPPPRPQIEIIGASASEPDARTDGGSGPSLERRAADRLVAGDLAEAARLYDLLSEQYPTSEVYRATARLLRRDSGAGSGGDRRD